MTKNSQSALTPFHPLLRHWFTSRYPAPTEIQSLAWPVITAGSHVLLTAPTGNGKTLTAFLWALDCLLTNRFPAGRISVLYVSPLKALNNDIRCNLLTPLAELEEIFREAGEPFTPPRVLTRSGDTPQQERRRMLRTPPEILITTPESLNLLLASPRARPLLTSIRTVILDEIHALASSKRGTYLMTAVDRLVPLCGEFQRIVLSATVTPLDVIADFTAGYKLEESNEGPRYHKREMKILQATGTKDIDLQITFPPDARETMVEGSWWPSIVRRIKEIIHNNNSTLIFANSRSLCEKLTRWLNEAEPERLAYAHHGSLSKEIRREVEQQLKAGQLAAIVATSSLELGIDIGSLDEVILVQTPFTISSALQRIGRAGHSVGQLSRGSLFPLHGRDFLEAAVMAQCLEEKEIEDSRPVLCPLDILAQVILAMTAINPWPADKLYTLLRTSYPYHNLTEQAFTMVLNMLQGLYADTKIRELAPRLSLDSQSGTLSARPGTLPLLYMSGGTIANRGYFDLRVEGSNAKIGELDEEFVWERRIGHSFCLGTQAWKIVAMDDRKVQVVPWQGQLSTLPFWKAEQIQGSFTFAEKTGLFLETWNSRLESREFLRRLQENHHMDEAAAKELVGFLNRQRKFSGCDLPHRHHLLIEHFTDLNRQGTGKMVIIHTLWGGQVNFPFALALGAWLEAKLRRQLEVFSDNNCVMLLLPDEFAGAEILQALGEQDLEALIRCKLETTGFFGARFRENAGRALLLPKAGFGKRLPLWLNRLRSRKLMEAVLPYSDFPILVETWRGCVQEEFDMPALQQLLAELAEGKIRCTEIETTIPTPFADGLIWRQTDNYMYTYDTPTTGKISNVSGDIFRQVIFSAQLRPRLAPGLCRDFTAKMQRTYRGYAPDSSRGLLDLVRDRQLIPHREWENLLEAIKRDHGLKPAALLEEIKSQLVLTRLAEGAPAVICAVDTLPRLLKALALSGERLILEPPGPQFRHTPRQRQRISEFLHKAPASSENLPEARLAFLLSWLSYYGPLAPAYPAEVLGLAAVQWEELLETAVEAEELLYDHITSEATSPEICLRENLEILLRLARKKARPGIDPRPLAALPLFLKEVQYTDPQGKPREKLQNCLEKLFGYPAPAGLWEQEILPARLAGYRCQWLDELLSESDLFWFGCGRHKISFALGSDSDLFLTAANGEDSPLLPHSRGRFSFWEIKDHTGLSSAELTGKLWEEVWKGRLGNTSLKTLRQALASRFKPPRTPARLSPDRSPPTRRSRFHTWKAAQPTSGAWYLLTTEEKDNLLYSEELTRDSIRQLLLRYGILFRELLAQELPHLHWSGLFKSLQIMELGGEVISGYFFQGIAGIQFLPPSSLPLLTAPGGEDTIFWLNACDPLSLCGRSLPFAEALPPRLPSNHLVYHGTRLVLISRKQGKNLEFRLPPENPRISEYLQFFHVSVNRATQPRKYIKVEEINGRPASQSPYREACLQAGFTEGYKCLELRKQY